MAEGAAGMEQAGKKKPAPMGAGSGLLMPGSLPGSPLKRLLRHSVLRLATGSVRAEMPVLHCRCRQSCTQNMCAF